MSDKRSETLAWFAEQMMAKLESNREKGDWLETGVNHLEWALAYADDCEIGELHEAITNRDWANVIAEAADVGNYCMMIADTARQYAAMEAERRATRGKVVDVEPQG